MDDGYSFFLVLFFLSWFTASRMPCLPLPQGLCLLANVRRECLQRGRCISFVTEQALVVSSTGCGRLEGTCTTSVGFVLEVGMHPVRTYLLRGQRRTRYVGGSRLARPARRCLFE